MRKERIEYGSSVDALVAVAKRLSIYESRYGMTSEELYDRYQKGQREDSVDFVEWANDYQHYIEDPASPEYVVPDEARSHQDYAAGYGL